MEFLLTHTKTPLTLPALQHRGLLKIYFISKFISLSLSPQEIKITQDPSFFFMV